MKVTGVGGHFAGVLTADARPRPEIVTRAEFARRIGVAKSYINQMIERGIIDDSAIAEDGKIILAVARAQWNAQKSTTRREDQIDWVDEKTGAVTRETAEALDDRPRAMGTPGSRLTEQKISRGAIAEELEKIKLAKEKGQYRDVEKIAAAIQSVLGVFVSELANIPGWTDDLVVMRDGDERTIRNYLEKQARALRQDITDALSGLLGTEDDGLDS